MNAYELADDLENSNGLQYITKVGLVSLSAKMLRQQADRIAELEDRLSMYEIKDLDRGIIGRTKDYVIHDLVHRTTPQIKELSDEEIEDLIDNWDFGLDISPKHHMFLLCKTILKKASEQ